MCTRSITLIHVSRVATAGLWEMLQHGLPDNIPCVALPLFFQPQHLAPTLRQLADFTCNQAYAPKEDNTQDAEVENNDSSDDDDEIEGREFTDEQTNDRLKRKMRKKLKATAEASSPFHSFVYQLQTHWGVPLLDESLYVM